jgi:hypothetical protein
MVSQVVGDVVFRKISQSPDAAILNYDCPITIKLGLGTSLIALLFRFHFIRSGVLFTQFIAMKIGFYSMWHNSSLSCETNFIISCIYYKFDKKP